MDTNVSSEPLRIAATVRAACLQTLLDAYEDAGFRGLCAEGRWEAAIDALRTLPLNELMVRPDSTPVGDGKTAG